jgi:hypothetical protein
VGALADPAVGEYLNRHFVCSFQKVGSFRLVDGQKQGGNVASYFCTPNGGILDAAAGPVDAAVLLREARWAVETRKMALLESRGDVPRYKQFFRLAHAEQLPGSPALAGVNWQSMSLAPTSPAALAGLLDTDPTARELDAQGKIHLLLALYPLAPLDQLYKVVYDKILNETVSTRPVAVGAASQPESGAPSWNLLGRSAPTTPLPGTPLDAEEVREQRRARELSHARNDAGATEVYGGAPLNTLLGNLATIQEQGGQIRAAPLAAEVLAHINVTAGADGTTAGRLKDGGKLRWPLAWHDPLLWNASAALRESVEDLLPQAVAQARKGPVGADLLLKLRDDTRRLDGLLTENVNRLAASTYVAARRYVKELDASLGVLERDDAGRYVDGTFALDSAGIKTVPDLIAFMRQKGLSFSPAVGGDESAYLALHRALASCDTVVEPSAKANAGDL